MKLSRVGVDLAKNVYQLHGVDRVGEMDQVIKRLAENNEDCVRLQQLRGVGPMIATAMALANKTARMAWAMLRNKTDYNPDFAIS